MLGFIELKTREDITNAYKLFISKETMNRGRVLINNYYFIIKESEKTYMVVIEDSNKKKIVNCIFAKPWFESNVIDNVESMIKELKPKQLFTL